VAPPSSLGLFTSTRQLRHAPRSRRHALVALTIASFVSPSLPARAQTSDAKANQIVPVVTGAASLSISLLPLALLGLGSKETIQEHRVGFAVTMYIAAGIGLGLAATTFGLEATTPGKCTADCAGAYTTAAFGAALSSLGLALAISLTVAPARAKKRHGAMVVPLVIPSGKAPALGVGLVGVTF
jgi:type IV secretory pathway VirB2 component (pilin)